MVACRRNREIAESLCFYIFTEVWSRPPGPLDPTVSRTRREAERARRGGAARRGVKGEAPTAVKPSRYAMHTTPCATPQSTVTDPTRRPDAVRGPRTPYQLRLRLAHTPCAPGRTSPASLIRPRMHHS